VKRWARPWPFRSRVQVHVERGRGLVGVVDEAPVVGVVAPGAGHVDDEDGQEPCAGQGDEEGLVGHSRASRVEPAHGRERTLTSRWPASGLLARSPFCSLELLQPDLPEPRDLVAGAVDLTAFLPWAGLVPAPPVVVNGVVARSSYRCQSRRLGRISRAVNICRSHASLRGNGTAPLSRARFLRFRGLNVFI